MEKSKYYVVRDKALPEVLQKVAEAKQLLDKNRSMTVQEATERLGLSRSSFYKYKDVRDKALPEVLQKVAEAKQLLDKNRSMTVQEATERLGLSRSSFYKYKDDIAPFSDNTRGKTVTLVIQMEDEPGLLSDLLHVVSDYRANILTIHQTIPVNGIATVTLSVEVRDNTGDMSGLVEEIENMTGIQNIKILGVER